MILLVPVVVAGLARLSRRLPLTLRYAVRDAARHRTRTVPAVAAVAATVAGVVALGIANTSDDAQNRAEYTPQLSIGQASLTQWKPRQDLWPPLRAAVERYVPGRDRSPSCGASRPAPRADGRSTSGCVRGTRTACWTCTDRRSARRSW